VAYLYQHFPRSSYPSPEAEAKAKAKAEAQREAKARAEARAVKRAETWLDILAAIDSDAILSIR
jgi:hypothetical protein